MSEEVKIEIERGATNPFMEKVYRFMELSVRNVSIGYELMGYDSNLYAIRRLHRERDAVQAEMAELWEHVEGYVSQIVTGLVRRIEG